MSPIDIILAAVVMLGFWLGYSRGIIQTVFTILSYGFGLIVAMRFSPSVTRLLEEQIYTSPLMFLAGFFVTFVGAMLFLRFIGRSIETLLKSVNINIINRVIGAGVTAGFFVLIFSILLSFARSAHLVSDRSINASVSYPYVKKFPEQAKEVYHYTRPIILAFWNESTFFLDRVENTLQENEGEPSIFDIEETEVRKPGEDSDR